MTAATKTKPATEDALEDFERAYAEVTKTISALREAYGACDSASRGVSIAGAAERERVRAALVSGRPHFPSGAVGIAAEALAIARRHVAELKAADQEHQRALSAAVQRLIDAGGKPALGDLIGQLINSGQERLDLAVDEVDAARRQVGMAIALLGWLDGSARAGLGQPAGLSSVAGLQSRHGEDYDWGTVESALRSLGAAAREMLRRFDARKAPRQIRVSQAEKLTWHRAAGGDYSDSLAQVNDAYAERGPRRAEAALDAQEADTGRTSDQRTWAAD